jgi:hypothetical protein
MSNPPDHVKSAAADQWVRDQEVRQLSADEIAKLTPAQRLDYVRQFDQRSMPAWQDPRKV